MKKKMTKKQEAVLMSEIAKCLYDAGYEQNIICSCCLINAMAEKIMILFKKEMGMK